MYRIHLDYQKDKPTRQWGVLVLLCALLVAGGLLNHYRHLMAALQQQEDASVRIKRQSPSATRSNDADSNHEIEAANRLLLELSTPWAALFHAIETVSNRQVSLLSIDPDAQKSWLKISGRAKNLPAILEYMRQLEAEATLSNVYLQQHQIDTVDSEHPIQFVLAASWEKK